MSVVEYRNKISACYGKCSLLQKQYDEQIRFIEKKKTELISIEKAQAFIQGVAKATQEQLKFHVEDTVNLALDSIFPNEYVFSIAFEISRGKTEARLIFVKNGCEIDILKSAGGGVVDIVSLALRIAVWSLSKTEPVLILDEPIARIQPAALQSTAWEIIEQLSKRLKLQFIIISNSANNGDIHLLADKEFKVLMKQETLHGEEWGITTVQEL